MNTIRCHIFLICVICLLSSITCDKTVSGGGSSTGNANTISGIILQPDGTTPAICYVHAYPSDSIPRLAGSSIITDVAADTSDSNGRFTLKNIPDGTYNLYCNDTAYPLSTLLMNKMIRNNDSLFTGIDTLKPEITISGKVQNSTGLQTIAFVYGSPIITAINDSSGFFQLRGLPLEDNLAVSFLGIEPGNETSCRAEYLVTQLPDTSLYVDITLECD